MSTDRKLPPIRFAPERVERPWGRMEYLLADLGAVDSTVVGGWLAGNTISEVMQTYLDRVVGDAAFEYYGTQFPLMVKTLDVKGRTSLHVNPDEETAAQRYDAFGKMALWHVLEAGEDSVLYLGFRRDVSAEEFFLRCNEGSVEELLNIVKPRVGESYLVHPGLVHAASKVKLLEIAESSECWFRLHDWGSKDRENHLEEAFDLIDFKATKSLGTENELFTVRELPLSSPLVFDAGLSDSFHLFTCVKGSAEIETEEGDRYPVKAGEVILVPSEHTQITITPSAEGVHLLEALYEGNGLGKD